MRKITALIGIAALLCAVFCGCGTSSSVHSYSGTEGQSSGLIGEIEDAMASPSTETTSGTPETVTSYLIDWDGDYAAYDPDTVVVRVNGQDVTWEEYYYWVYQAYYTLSYYIGDVADWDAIFPYDESMTYQDYVLDYVEDMILQYHVLDTKAAELGVTLTEEDEAEFERLWQENVDYYEDEETLLSVMAEQHLSKELYRYMVDVSLLYDRLYESMYGVDGVELDEEESKALRSKLLTLEPVNGKGRHSKYNFKAFTRKGLYMLATCLN